MKLVVKLRAAATIGKIGRWVEEQNTDGSGERWVNKVYDYFEDIARVGLKLTLCKNEDLARQNFSCFTYNSKWVIAYRIKGDELIIYRFIWGAFL